MLKIFLLFSSLLAFSKIFAAETILCSHPQVCNLLSIIYPSDKLQSSVVFVGDHHHYEPNSNVIKNFIEAPILVTGPKALHPWLTPILKKRSEKLINIDASIDINFTETYQSKSPEVLAHFWLYPDIACDFLDQYQTKFKKHKIQFEKHTTADCLKKYSSSWDELIKLSKKISTPIVLTHDALIPLLKKLNLKVFALKGSNHHEDISPNAVKSLHGETKNTEVIWIQEEGFEVPPAIKRLIKKNDKVITIDTNGKKGDDVSLVLSVLKTKLNQTL